MSRPSLQASFFAAVALALQALGCSPTNAPSKVAGAPNTAPLKVSCVGEQTTHSAHRANDPEYPERLGQILGASHQVLNRGLPKGRVLQAATAPESEGYISSDVFALRLEDQPQIVIVGPWGRHDTYEGNWPEHQAEFSTDLQELVTAYTELESQPTVFLVTPLPFNGGTDHPISDLRTPTEALAQSMSLPLIDLWSTFLGHSEWYKDGTHLTPEGQQQHAKAVAKAITQIR